MEYHVGITGTRNGCNPNQFNALKHALNLIKEQKPDYTLYFHHGDCIGVDDQGATIAKSLGYEIVCHPPEKEDLRAFNKNYGKILPKKGYFARNRDIVDASNILIGVPRERKEDVSSYTEQTGGTWYTINYAVKKNKQIYVIYA